MKVDIPFSVMQQEIAQSVACVRSGGRPKTGRMMMELGFETSDPESEGFVSTEVVKMRLSLDHPMVPESLLEVICEHTNELKSYDDYMFRTSFVMKWMIFSVGGCQLPQHDSISFGHS